MDWMEVEWSGVGGDGGVEWESGYRGVRVGGWRGGVWSGVEVRSGWSGVLLSECSGMEWSGVEERGGVEWGGAEWVEWSGVECSGVQWSGVEWSGVAGNEVNCLQLSAQKDILGINARGAQAI